VRWLVECRRLLREKHWRLLAVPFTDPFELYNFPVSRPDDRHQAQTEGPKAARWLENVAVQRGPEAQERPCSSDRTQAHKKHTRTARKMIPLEILGSRSDRHKSPRAVIASRSRFRFVRYIRRASTPPPACSVGPSLTLSCPLAKWSVASTGAATTPYDGSPA
jgi:hypothetical protein